MHPVLPIALLYAVNMNKYDYTARPSRLFLLDAGGICPEDFLSGHLTIRTRRVTCSGHCSPWSRIVLRPVGRRLPGSPRSETTPECRYWTTGSVGHSPVQVFRHFPFRTQTIYHVNAHTRIVRVVDLRLFIAHVLKLSLINIRACERSGSGENFRSLLTPFS